MVALHHIAGDRQIIHWKLKWEASIDLEVLLLMLRSCGSGHNQLAPLAAAAAAAAAMHSARVIGNATAGCCLLPADIPCMQGED